MKIKLTKAGWDLITEALQMLMDQYEAQAKDALDDDEDEAFHAFANKVLAAKFIIREIKGKQS